MFHVLRQYLSRQAHFTEEDFLVMESSFVEKRLGKGEFLLREGEISKHGAFVAKGCLRSYTIDNKGKEHILQFAPEEWWIGNIASARTNTPSAYFIDAIEDSDLLLIDGSSFETSMQKVPGFAAGFRAGIERHAAAKDQRIIASLSASAEERYINFLQKYPTIAQRVPQHMLASYLGVSPETLSRVRKQMSKRK